MSTRSSLVSALAMIVPVVAVLIAVLALARPSTNTPVAPTGADPATPASTASGMASAGGKGQSVAPRPSGPRAPELSGGGAWINSEPLTLAGLQQQNKVVLVDFWTYGCYNCANTLPYIKQWWDTYKDQGLVIVGVHTPEFDSERVLENVQDAVERQEIGWPVVQDNDKQIWQAYGNHYWPRFYLIDNRGQIIYDHIGEGAYEETERQIQTALAVAKSEQ
jgi:thiol-disulfide isomerase/thioredoxin